MPATYSSRWSFLRHFRALQKNMAPHMAANTSHSARFNPFSTAVPIRGQTSLIPSDLPPKRDWGPKRVKGPTGCLRVGIAVFLGICFRRKSRAFRCLNSFCVYCSVAPPRTRHFTRKPMIALITALASDVEQLADECSLGHYACG